MTDEPESQPRFVVHADDRATVERGGAKYELSGAFARVIIASWRHCAEHPSTGPTDAALYLWGVINGMQYQQMREAEKLIEESRRNRALAAETVSAMRRKYGFDAA
jgi:hypothetical protein